MCCLIFADYLKGHGLSGIKIGFVLAITPILMFLIQPFYGMLADRLGYKKCLILSSGLASISYALYLVDTSFIWIVFVTVFMSVFYNALQPILDSLSLRLAQNNPKFSYGTLRIAGAAGWAFTGIITGQLIDAIVVAGFRDLSSCACKQPIFFPDVLPLQVKDPGICIKLLSQAPARSISFQQLLSAYTIHTKLLMRSQGNLQFSFVCISYRL